MAVRKITRPITAAKERSIPFYEKYMLSDLIMKLGNEVIKHEMIKLKIHILRFAN